MKRRAIIIGNPGEAGADNYCKGVYNDVERYKRYLLQPYGGVWDNSEIIGPMIGPSAAAVRGVIAELKLKPPDYLMVIFSGHGDHSEDSDSTILELSDGETLNERDFYKISLKTTIILDCCRRGERATLEEAVKGKIATAAALAELHPLDCLQYYNQRIEECGDILVVLYACSVGEYAYDRRDGAGGVYSDSLLSLAEAWVEGKRREIDTSKDYSILSVIGAQGRAERKVIELMEGRQTPNALKPRLPQGESYFPFAVVA